MVENMLSSAHMKNIHLDYHAQMIIIQKQKDHIEQKEYERIAAFKKIQQQNNKRRPIQS